MSRAFSPSPQQFWRLYNVRYHTLKNGYTEMTTVLMSVKSSIEDTHMIQTTNRGDHLQKLLDKLYQLEKDISSEMIKVTHLSDPLKSVNLLEVGMVGLTAHRRPRLIDIFASTLEALQLFNPQFTSYLWAGARFVLTLGQTPQLFRWYLVRDKVLEMTLQRERVQSRMLFYQMCHVHSRLASQEDSIHKLTEETNQLRDRLAEMRSFMEEIIKGVNGDREHLAPQDVLGG